MAKELPLGTTFYLEPIPQESAFLPPVATPFKEEGPEVEEHMLDEHGERLKAPFHVDLDKCECPMEVFEAGVDDSVPWVCLKNHEVTVFRPRGRIAVFLGPKPWTTRDLEKLIIRAAELATDEPLEARNMKAAARLVPAGQPDGIPIEGLPYPIEGAEGLMLGQVIQNYVNYGEFICTNGVAKSLTIYDHLQEE